MKTPVDFKVVRHLFGSTTFGRGRERSAEINVKQ